MAQTRAVKNKNNETPATGRTKAAQAVSNNPRGRRNRSADTEQTSIEELQEQLHRDPLRYRIIAGGVLVLLTLFAILSMVGIHALALDLIRKLFQGLLGYGFWLLPLAFLYMAWLLIFEHSGPITGRMVSTGLMTVAVSSLVHTILCKTTFQPGLSMFKDLWTTGTENASGGVLPGLLSELLQKLVSNVGTVLVLILGMVVLVFFMLRLSPAKLVHDRAERRREQLQELEADGLIPDTLPEEPVTYDTRADLSVLARPIARPRPEPVPVGGYETPAPRKQRSFDLPLGPTKKTRSRKSGDSASFLEPQESPVPEPQADEFDIFADNQVRKVDKRTGQTRTVTPSGGTEYWMDGIPEGYDIPLDGTYTSELDQLLQTPKAPARKPAKKTRKDPQNPAGLSWMDSFIEDLPDEEPAPRSPQTAKEGKARKTPQNPAGLSWMDSFIEDLPDEEPAAVSETIPAEPVSPAPKSAPAKAPTVTDADLEVVKEKKLSHGEASMAAAEVALEIEARTDQEAQEKPEYVYPPMSMLAEAMTTREDNTEEMRNNVLRLEQTLASFGVDIHICNVVRGPAVTRYEMELKPGVKMNKITSLHEDIALSLGVSGVHVAAVPGKSSTIGIEVPNSIVTSVPIKEVLESKEFRNHKSVLAFAAGKDISGNYIIGDIAKMPHLLIAGTTGSGKSVCMNSIIVSLLYRDSPEDCRLIMIDPKVVELSIYNGVPHLLIPVVTDPKKAAGALQWAVTEMDRRYNRFEQAKVRDLSGYNKKAAVDPELEPMPRIVIIIDELADLMMVAAKEVETSIARLAAKARAAGMHLVIATQRPSADVITGVIKANIPSRIAFAVSSALESNIIMGTRGAEKLLGKGDMFYAPQGADKPKRVQGCFISDEEVESVAEFVKNASEADYSDDIMNEIEQNAFSSSGKDSGDDADAAIDGEGDPQLPDAVEVLLETKQASVSMLQRRLKLGYAHAARIMDELEEKGIVGPFEGSKPRQLLIDRATWDTMVGINPRAVGGAPEASEDGPEEDVPFDEDEEQ